MLKFVIYVAIVTLVCSCQKINTGLKKTDSFLKNNKVLKALSCGGENDDPCPTGREYYQIGGNAKDDQRIKRQGRGYF